MIAFMDEIYENLWSSGSLDFCISIYIYKYSIELFTYNDCNLKEFVYINNVRLENVNQKLAFS